MKHQEHAAEHNGHATKHRTEVHKIHHSIKEDMIAAKQSFLELEQLAKEAYERLHIILSGLPKEDVITRIKQLRLSDKSLNFLCKGIILEDEDQDICMIVEDIKRERALNAEHDQFDHASYLDI